MVGRAGEEPRTQEINVLAAILTSSPKALGSIFVAFLYNLAPPFEAKEEDDGVSPQSTRQ